jgi:hypothetical protein
MAFDPEQVRACGTSYQAAAIRDCADLCGIAESSTVVGADIKSPTMVKVA